MSPYEILSVGRRAPLDEIKRAHRKLAKELPPDVNASEKAAAKRFKEITAVCHMKVGADRRRVLRNKYGRHVLPSRRKKQQARVVRQKMQPWRRAAQASSRLSGRVRPSRAPAKR